MDLISTFLTKEIAMLIVGIISILYFVGKIPINKNRRVSETAWWYKLLPILPSVLGVPGAFLPGVFDNSMSWGTKILMGIIAGFIASSSYKTIKRMVVDKFKEKNK